MTRQHLLAYAWPLFGLGGLLAAACLTSMWYISRLQNELGASLRKDASSLKATQELQIRLRQLRFRSVLCAADPSPDRRAEVTDELASVEASLVSVLAECGEADLPLVDSITTDLRVYAAEFRTDAWPAPPLRTLADLVRWSDERHVAGILAPCRDLVGRHEAKMDATLKRSEAQTRWAGRVLLGLGLAGALGGVLSGYAIARRLSRGVTRLSVRVQAVHAQLDQNVGDMTVEEETPLADLDAQLERVVGRVRDVCERLQKQERELLRAEQLAAVGQLAAGVAHEVRNPLTGIKFLIEAAVRPVSPTALAATDLHLIRHEILRIERTVQGLLDFARAPTLDRRPHDLRELVTEAVGIARGRAEAKSVVVRVGPHPAPLAAAVDRDQCLALLSNLLFNAIDAAPVGGEVGVFTSIKQGGMIRVDVTDTGPGIDPSIADRLFTPFVTTKPTGTGLGLAMALRVAREHGGTLTAENRPGGGACFTVTLPAAESARANAPGGG